VKGKDRKLIIVFLLFLLGATSLQAKDWYVGGWGGVSDVRDGVEHLKFDVDLGPTAGAFLGMSLTRDYQLEIEAFYRQNHIDDIIEKGKSTGLHGYYREYGLYLNGLCEFPYCWKVVPFFGMGFGWSYETIDLKAPGIKGFQEVDSGWGGQLILGLVSHLKNERDVFVRYCYEFLDPDTRASTFVIGMKFPLGN